MKIKVMQPLLGVNDTPLLNEQNEPLYLKDVCINAILTPQQDDTEVIKLTRYEIYKELKHNSIVDLPVEHVSFLKKSIGQCYAALVVGQCFEMIENAETT